MYFGVKNSCILRPDFLQGVYAQIGIQFPFV